jgi:GDP-mannose 6-dehydrogenase
LFSKIGPYGAGVDINPQKVAAVNAGWSPIVEPQVHGLLQEALASKRLSAVEGISDGLRDVDLALICVGTPSDTEGRQDLGYVTAASQEIAHAVQGANRRDRPITVACRSTVRPGTMEGAIEPGMRSILGDERINEISLAYYPEFLREGSAVDDFFDPPKVVIGTQDGAPNSTLTALASKPSARVFHMTYQEAELTKLMDNSWHALKVTFANEIGRLCLELGVSAASMHELFVADTKLNISAAYTRPGGAFGGSCLPKDLRALAKLGVDNGIAMPVVRSIMESNEAHKLRMFAYAIDGLRHGASVLLAGLAFKPGTDDLRESQNVDLARRLLRAGYALEIYDPAVRFTSLVGRNLSCATTTLPDVQQSLVTREWAERSLYDRVIAASHVVDDLNLPSNQDVRRIDVLP